MIALQKNGELCAKDDRTRNSTHMKIGYGGESTIERNKARKFPKLVVSISQNDGIQKGLFLLSDR